MPKAIWVTTETNPFDPFTQFDRWMNWDFEACEGVCCALAREAGTSVRGLTDSENEAMINIAVNKLLDREYGSSIPVPYIDKDGNYKRDKDGRILMEHWTIHYVPAIEGQTLPWGA